MAICGLLHDVCKIDTYKVDFRNVKTEQGWESRPYYTMDEELPYGHGEKSVYIINGFMRLTREEAMAINWHMGSFDDRVRGGSYAISRLTKDTPWRSLCTLPTSRQPIWTKRGHEPCGQPEGSLIYSG